MPESTNPLTPGIKGEYNTLVTPEIAVDFLGLDTARVLGTPYLIMLTEMTCRNSVKPYLEDGFDTVGTHVDIKHLAATPLGMRVTFRTELTGVDDRRLRFRVAAFDEKEQVAEGTHERFIVHIARFATRLQAKLASRST